MNPLEILCRWAWAKVHLEILRQENAADETIADAIRALNRATKQRNKLNALNRHTDHLTLVEVGLDRQLQLL